MRPGSDRGVRCFAPPLGQCCVGLVHYSAIAPGISEAAMVFWSLCSFQVQFAVMHENSCF